MPEQSYLAYYHNQEDGSVYPDGSGAIRDPRDTKYLEWVKNEERRATIEKLGPSEELKKMVENLVSSIKSARLEEIVQDDPEQVAELEKAKNNSTRMLLEVFEKVGAYLQTIRNMDLVVQKKRDLNQQDFLNELESADKTRTIAHNALISQIIATVRYISRTFAEISPQAIEEWEREREARGHPVVMIKRQKLPANIFISDKIDLKNRDQIASWADLISIPLSRLSQEIKKGPSSDMALEGPSGPGGPEKAVNPQ